MKTYVVIVKKWVFPSHLEVAGVFEAAAELDWEDRLTSALERFPWLNHPQYDGGDIQVLSPGERIEV